jgi:hypothetical protein
VFADAYEIAARFTVPVVVSMRLHTGDVHCSVGSAIVVNEGGWLVTVAHVLEPLDLHQRHQPEIAAYDRAVAEILKGPDSADEKQSRVDALDDGNRWIRNCSIWFGRDEWSVPTFQVLAAADLAIGKIENFDRAVIAGYPRFRNRRRSGAARASAGSDSPSTRSRPPTTRRRAHSISGRDRCRFHAFRTRG